MCRRLSLFTPQSVLEDRFGARAADPLSPRYNISPGDALSIITNDEPGTIRSATWGYVPTWLADEDAWPDPPIARVESLTTNPAYREAFADTRCLVLADGLYVWDGSPGDAQPYRVTRTESEPFGIAGLWQPAPDGMAGPTVAILTTEANAMVAPVQPRMPALLDVTDETDWLARNDRTALRSMLDPVPADGLHIFPVSTSLNDPSRDGPALTQPIEIGRRSVLSD